MSEATGSRRVRAALFVGGALAACAATLSAQATPAVQAAPAAHAGAMAFDPAVTVGTLPNGMRYYIQAHHVPEHRVELRLVVDAGSVLETPSELGVAHFVEHMAFNGSRHFAKLEIMHQLEAMGMQFGADLNASTTADETSYRLSIPTDKPGTLATGMRILADWAGGVTFDSAAVEAERGIIYGEWRLRANGAADYERARRYMSSVLRGSQYGDRLPIGDTRIIQHVSRAELQRFYKRWYRPQRMAVIVVGDIDPKAVEQLVRQEMGAIPADPHAPESDRAFPPRTVPVQSAPSYVVAEDPQVPGPSASLVYRMPEVPSGGERRSELVEEILTSIVGDHLSDMLVPSSSIFDQPARHARTWTLQTSAAGDLRAIVARLAKVGRQVVEHGLTDKEVEEARKQILTGRESQYKGWSELPSPVLAEQYQAAFLTGGAVPPADTALAIVRAALSGPTAITTAEVNAAARTILEQQGVVAFVAFPSAGQHVDDELVGAIVDSVRRAPTKVYVATRDTASAGKAKQQAQAGEATDSALAARPLIAKLPTAGRVDSVSHIPAVGITAWTLSNGAHVLLKPTRFNQDQIFVYGVAPGGLSRAQPSEYIDAGLGIQMISAGGLGEFTPDELRRKLSAAGTVAGADWAIRDVNSTVFGSAVPRDMKTMFQLLYLKFAGQRIDTAAISRTKNDMRTALAQVQALVNEELQARRWHFDPRQRPFTADMVDSLDMQRARAFVNARFGDASNFTFVVVGAFDPDSIRPFVEQYLASLPSTHVREGVLDNGARQPNGPDKIDVPGGVPGRTGIILSYTVPVRYDPAAPLRINAIAEIAQRRVLARLRTQLSATYGVGLSVQPAKYPWAHADVSVNFDSDPQRADSLAQAALAVLDTLARSGPTPKEVEDVIAFEKQQLGVALQQNGYWLQVLAQNALDGFDVSTGLVSPDPRIGALTLEQLRATAAEVFGSAQKAVRIYSRPPS